MPKHLLVYRCLIISPSDVAEHRDAIEDVISTWNGQVGKFLDVQVAPIRWESHTRPSVGTRPQGIVNEQIVDDADFAVALFWTKVGTPTGTHESGSVEEIDRLVKSGREVMIYFCDAPVPQSALKDEQFQNLQKLKGRYSETALYGSYTSVDDLRNLFGMHLTNLISGRVVTDRTGEPSPTAKSRLAKLVEDRTIAIIHCELGSIYEHGETVRIPLVFANVGGGPASDVLLEGEPPIPFGAIGIGQRRNTAFIDHHRSEGEEEIQVPVRISYDDHLGQRIEDEFLITVDRAHKGRIRHMKKRLVRESSWD